MEMIKQRMYTAECPECGASFAVRPGELTEEQLESKCVTCPKCGAEMPVEG